MAYTETIGIQLELMGEEGVRKDLEQLQSLLQGFSQKKGRVQVEADLKQAKADVIAYRGELLKLEKELNNLKQIQAVYSGLGIDTDEVDREIRQVQESMDVYKRKMKEAQQATRELQYALSSFKQMSFSQMFKKISTAVTHLGGRLQSLGNALTRFTAPFSQFTNGAILGIGYRFLNLMTQGFSAATERYDTVRTYRPIIQALGAGLSEDTAEANKQLDESYQALYKSILGLPTGMGEMLDRWKLLTIATQDYKKATELTIAENNALIASGTDEAVATMAKKQLQTLMTTGKLTERQWMSLQKGIPIAWDMIEKELQSSGRISGRLIDNLKKGKISAEEFGDALIRVTNTEEFEKILNEIKHTFSAALENITNYSMNLGQRVLSAIDNILKAAFGKDIIE